MYYSSKIVWCISCIVIGAIGYADTVTEKILFSNAVRDERYADAIRNYFGYARESVGLIFSDAWLCFDDNMESNVFGSARLAFELPMNDGYIPTKVYLNNNYLRKRANFPEMIMTVWHELGHCKQMKLAKESCGMYSNYFHDINQKDSVRMLKKWMKIMRCHLFQTML